VRQSDYNLEERLLAFSADVVRHCARLKQPILRSIVDQVVRSATSIGANYAEANNASSKQDFRAKVFIAKKEASETRYWLRLLGKVGDNSEELEKLCAESQELVMILQKIVNSLRKKSEN
jgi:four helix bundle protein